MFGIFKDRAEVLRFSESYSGYDWRDYTFLESSIHLNDFQFGLIFQKERGMGRTWGRYMDLLLKCKHIGEIEVTVETFNNNSSMPEARAEFKGFLPFVREYFIQDFDVAESDNKRVKLKYTGHRFKALHPECRI